MNYYQYHIGDFGNATRHLTRIERSIYRDLLDVYYDTEQPLTTDIQRLSRICMIDKQDKKALLAVLSEFFTLTNHGYENKRANREIETYKKQVEGGRRGNEKRWGGGVEKNTKTQKTTSSLFDEKIAPRHGGESRGETGASRNHEPVTMNHKPVTRERAPQKQRLTLFDGNTEIPKDWADWATEQRPDLVPEAVYFKFRVHWQAEGSKKADWFAAWQRWVIGERQGKAAADVARATVPRDEAKEAAAAKAAKEVYDRQLKASLASYERDRATKTSAKAVKK